MSIAYDVPKFWNALAEYLYRIPEQEFVPYAKKEICRIVAKNEKKKDSEALAMKEILWYLSGAFPSQVYLLKEMEAACAESIQSTENT